MGVEHAITKEDAVITSHRAHGWSYMRGVSVLGIMAELAGKYMANYLLFCFHL